MTENLSPDKLDNYNDFKRMLLKNNINCDSSKILENPYNNEKILFNSVPENSNISNLMKLMKNNNNNQEIYFNSKDLTIKKPIPGLSQNYSLFNLQKKMNKNTDTSLQTLTQSGTDINKNVPNIDISLIDNYNTINENRKNINKSNLFLGNKDELNNLNSGKIRKFKNKDNENKLHNSKKKDSSLLIYQIDQQNSDNRAKLNIPIANYSFKSSKTINSGEKYVKNSNIHNYSLNYILSSANKNKTKGKINNENFCNSKKNLNNTSSVTKNLSEERNLMRSGFKNYNESAKKISNSREKSSSKKMNNLSVFDKDDFNNGDNKNKSKGKFNTITYDEEYYNKEKAKKIDSFLKHSSSKSKIKIDNIKIASKNQENSYVHEQEKTRMRDLSRKSEKENSSNKVNKDIFKNFPNYKKNLDLKNINSNQLSNYLESLTKSKLKNQSDSVKKELNNLDNKYISNKSKEERKIFEKKFLQQKIYESQTANTISGIENNNNSSQNRNFNENNINNINLPSDSNSEIKNTINNVISPKSINFLKTDFMKSSLKNKNNIIPYQDNESMYQIKTSNICSSSNNESIWLLNKTQDKDKISNLGENNKKNKTNTNQKSSKHKIANFKNEDSLCNFFSNSKQNIRLNQSKSNIINVSQNLNSDNKYKNNNINYLNDFSAQKLINASEIKSPINNVLNNFKVNESILNSTSKLNKIDLKNIKFLKMQSYISKNSKRKSKGKNKSKEKEIDEKYETLRRKIEPLDSFGSKIMNSKNEVHETINHSQKNKSKEKKLNNNKKQNLSNPKIPNKIEKKSCEKTIHINHNYSHNILINIENRNSNKPLFKTPTNNQHKRKDFKEKNYPEKGKNLKIDIINQDYFNDIEYEYLNTENPNNLNEDNPLKNIIESICSTEKQFVDDNYVNKEFSKSKNYFFSRNNLKCEQKCKFESTMNSSNKKPSNEFNSKDKINLYDKNQILINSCSSSENKANLMNKLNVNFINSKMNQKVNLNFNKKNKLLNSKDKNNSDRLNCNINFENCLNINSQKHIIKEKIDPNKINFNYKSFYNVSNNSSDGRDFTNTEPSSNMRVDQISENKSKIINNKEIFQNYELLKNNLQTINVNGKPFQRNSKQKDLIACETPENLEHHLILKRDYDRKNRDLIKKGNLKISPDTNKHQKDKEKITRKYPNNEKNTEKLELIDVQKLNFIKNKMNLFEKISNLNKTKLIKKDSNNSNYFIEDERLHEIKPKKSQKLTNKIISQYSKYSSSSKSKSNSLNKDSCNNKEKDLLEETISYIISEDELTSNNDKVENKNENFEQKNSKNSHNDDLDFENFYNQMNIKFMNNTINTSK